MTAAFSLLLPKSVPLVEAAGISLVGETVVTGIDLCKIEGKGYKKAFIPAGFGGCGNYAIQILKKVYDLEVYTMFSTAKVDKVKALLPGVNIVDYTKDNYTDHF